MAGSTSLADRPKGLVVEEQSRVFTDKFRSKLYRMGGRRPNPARKEPTGMRIESGVVYSEGDVSARYFRQHEVGSQAVGGFFVAEEEKAARNVLAVTFESDGR